MRKNLYSASLARWHRSLMGSLWVSTLLFCLVLWPSSANAQGYIDNLKGQLGFVGDWIGYASKAGSAVTIADKILTFLGIDLSDPDTNNAILDEMRAIAAYQDATKKEILLNDAYDQYNEVLSYVSTTKPEAITQEKWEDWYAHASLHGLTKALSPGLECTGLAQFQTLCVECGAPFNFGTYEWRPGIQEALTAVATRLLVMSARTPDFRSNGIYLDELTSILGCLREHRDLIKPAVKPTPYCTASNCGTTSSTVTCKENRPSNSWSSIVTPSTMPFPGCSSPATSASETVFADLEEIAASKIDHDNLGNVVFSLQRVIDSLYLLIHSPATPQTPPSNLKDLAEADYRIYFGANSSLCLAQNSAGKLILINCSDATLENYGTWTYDRKRASIKNNKETLSPQCIFASSPSATPGTVYTRQCTPDLQKHNADEQTWSWNPESGVLRNAVGAVLGVGGTPGNGSEVLAMPENPWRIHQQAWASNPSICADGKPAFCPKVGSAVWTQGTITGVNMYGNIVDQRYPLDFNAFTYEQFNGPIDVAGPIASAGGIFAVGYNSSQPCGVDINHSSPLPFAVVSTYGPIIFTTGSIFGATSIPFYTSFPSTLTEHFAPQRYDFHDPPADSKPINFEMAFANLQGYSKKLQALPATGAISKLYSQLKLSGAAAHPGDPVVFNLKDEDFNGVYEIDYEVSGSPTILVNVAVSKNSRGVRNLTLWSMGFVSKIGNLQHPESILWNFADAEEVEMRYSKISGSILAPFATVRLYEGKLEGTVVAWSLGNTFEYYLAPFTSYQKLVTQ